jgi:DNA transposition AAA+ family ATPase
MMALAQTSVAVQIAGVIETLRRHGWSGAVLGPAGIGKTCAASAIANTTPLTYLITATEDVGNKPNLLWQMVAHALGLCGEDSAADTQQMLVSHHSLKGCVLIVDEAQQLPPKQLRSILTLWDRCELSVCFCGNLDVLQRARTRQRGWDQIETRLAITHRLEGFDEGDAAMLASGYGVEQPEAVALLTAIGERHYARGIVHVIEAAREVAGGRAIDAAGIRKALQVVPKYRPAIRPRVVTTGGS